MAVPLRCAWDVVFLLKSKSLPTILLMNPCQNFQLFQVLWNGKSIWQEEEEELRTLKQHFKPNYKNSTLDHYVLSSALCPNCLDNRFLCFVPVWLFFWPCARNHLSDARGHELGNNNPSFHVHSLFDSADRIWDFMEESRRLRIENRFHSQFIWFGSSG